MQGRLSPIIDNKIQSFPWMNWRNEFELASTSNIHTLEWTLDHDRLYENPLMNDEGTAEINKLSKKFNIRIPSLTGDCFMQKPFWKESGNQKISLQNDFINVIHRCGKIGISTIVVPLVDNGSIENKSQEHNLHKFLSSLHTLLNELSLKICFESDLPPTNLKNFISNYDKDQFGINYDIGNSASMGFDPMEEFAKYGNRIINIHMKDRVLGGSTIALGKGNANFELIFNLIKDYNYDGNIILQTARAKDDQHLKLLLKYYNFTKKLAIQSNIPISN